MGHNGIRLFGIRRRELVAQGRQLRVDLGRDLHALLDRPDGGVVVRRLEEGEPVCLELAAPAKKEINE